MMAKESLTDKAYSRIKEWIIGFQLKPGSHISIQDLAEMLGISRTPVREALSRLEQEHLVVRFPMKGFAVKAMDLKEISDLFEVRTAIELLAVRQAAGRINGESRAQLAESISASEKLIKKGAKSQSIKIEQNFHMKILEASGNIPLAEIGRGILGRIWAIQSFNIITSDALEKSHQEHIEIFDALSDGSVKRALAMMQKHMKYATKELMARLKDRNDIIHNAIAFNPKTWQRLKRKK